MDGQLVGRSVGCSVRLMDGRLVSPLVRRIDVRSVGWLVGWMDGQMDGQLVGQLVGWLVDGSVGRLVCLSIGH